MVPVAVVAMLKIVGLLMLHLYFSASGSFTPPPKVNVLPGYRTRFPDLYLLTNWDSGWYLMIARYGCTEMPESVVGIPLSYFPLCLNFFPGYPALIRVLNFLLDDWVLSAGMISVVAGLCCVVVWQSICEDYLPRREAASSALVTFLFPPVFFVTTIAYAESLYLLAALLSWRFLTRDRLWKASAFAGVTSIIRPYGIVAMAPVMLRAWKRHSWKDWIVISGSLVPLAFWLFFGYQKTSRLFAYAYAHSIGWGELPTTISLVSKIIAGESFASLTSTWPWFTSLDVLMTVSLAVLFCLLCYRATQMNKELGIYGFVQYFIIITLADWTALLRYFGAVFPSWSIFMRRWRLPLLVFFCVLFYAGGMYLWQQFLIGGRAP
jgi:hypothetical protein